MSRLIAGVDPGTTESHVVIFDPSHRKAVEAMSLSNAETAEALRRWSQKYIEVAVEGMDPRGLRLGRETMDTLVWIGRFLEASGGVEVSRNAVRLHLCGSSRADDTAIRTVLLDKLGPKGTKKAPGPTYGISKHLWQALAVAVTYAETAEGTVVYDLTLDLEPREGQERES